MIFFLKFLKTATLNKLFYKNPNDHFMNPDLYNNRFTCILFIYNKIINLFHS